MATSISLAAQPRNASKTPRALRREQVIPGVVYGHNIEPKSVQFEAPALQRVVRRAGTSHLISLAVQGEDAPRNVLLREVQRDPVTSRILHVDLYATVAGEKIRITVPLVRRGASPAEQLGGMVMQTLEALEVECLPEDMPEFVEIDLSRLETLHSRLTVANLEIPAHVEVLTPMDTEVAGITLARMKAEVEEVVAAPVEGEAVAAAATTEEAKKEEKAPGAAPGR